MNIDAAISRILGIPEEGIGSNRLPLLMGACLTAFAHRIENPDVEILRNAVRGVATILESTQIPTEQGIDTAKGKRVSDEHRFIVYAKGCSLSNPGPAGVAFIILEERTDRQVVVAAKHIGISTKPLSEILATTEALNEIPADPMNVVEVRLTAEYPVKTMSGQFRRQTNWEDWGKLDEAIRRHGNVKFVHVAADDRWSEHVDWLARTAAYSR